MVSPAAAPVLQLQLLLCGEEQRVEKCGDGVGWGWDGTWRTGRTQMEGSWGKMRCVARGCFGNQEFCTDPTLLSDLSLSISDCFPCRLVAAKPPGGPAQGRR